MSQIRKWLGRVGAGMLAAAIVLTTILALPPGGVAPARAAEPIRVTATTGMIADLMRNVGGERVAVVALMGAGVDPHLYKPTAGDVGKLEDAQMIFYNGLELEGRMTDLLAKIGRAGTPAIAVAERIPPERLRAAPQFPGAYDPHVWFDVELWALAADAVAAELVAFDTDSAAAYEANLAAYRAELETLDREVQDRVEAIPAERRVLVTAHDAFGYFGDQYGVEVIGLQGTSTATEASANAVRVLADLIAERQIPAIFVESSVSPATVEAVREAVRARGLEVAIGGQLFSDAMGDEGTPAGTYLGMVRHNAGVIADALAGAPAAAAA